MKLYNAMIQLQPRPASLKIVPVRLCKRHVCLALGCYPHDLILRTSLTALNLSKIHSFVPQRYLVLLVIVAKILFMDQSQEKWYGVFG